MSLFFPFCIPEIPDCLHSFSAFILRFIPWSTKLWQLSHNLCGVIINSTYFSMIAPYLNCKFFVYYKQARGNLAGMIKFPPRITSYFLPFNIKIIRYKRSSWTQAWASFVLLMMISCVLLPKPRCLYLVETAGRLRHLWIPAAETEALRRSPLPARQHAQAEEMLPGLP